MKSYVYIYNLHAHRRRWKVAMNVYRGSLSSPEGRAARWIDPGTLLSSPEMEVNMAQLNIRRRLLF
jgi:hypothetical protein